MEKEEIIDHKSERERLLGLSEIGLWLDTYDDLFSDFDPRPFSQRALSVDFLDEIKRASKEKSSGAIQLTLMIPKNLKNIEKEIQIKKRLHEHFKKHKYILEHEIRKTVSNGFSIATLGFAFMFLAIMVEYNLTNDLAKIIITTLFQPSGWFLMFLGLDTAFYTSREKKPDIEFYKKMSSCEINFLSY